MTPQPQRHNLYDVIAISAVAALGGLLFGYDSSVISGAIEPLSQHYQLTPSQTGWAVSNVIIDFGDAERARCAGQSARAKRLPEPAWQRMVKHISELSRIAWREYGVRPVIHPHAGGFIEFGDEIDRIAQEIPAATAGLCLDTGHLYYAGLDPVQWLRKYADRIDYLHFKNVNKTVYEAAMPVSRTFSAPARRA